MSTSQETESHSSDYSADDLRSLGDVRAVLTALTKLIQGKKIYAKNNPTLAKFAKEFETSCQEYFAQEDELELTIEQYVIKFQQWLLRAARLSRAVDGVSRDVLAKTRAAFAAAGVELSMVH